MDKVYFFFFLNSFSMNKPEKVPVCATKQAALRPLLMCSYHHSLYQETLICLVPRLLSSCPPKPHLLSTSWLNKDKQLPLRIEAVLTLCE